MRSFHPGLLATSFVVFLYIIITFHKRADIAVLKPAIVGISLTPRYGISWRISDDGSFVDMTTINGDQDYFYMMTSLGAKEYSHPSPPYRNNIEAQRDLPRQIWRSTRKRLGLPASSDVLILSRMLKTLYHAASLHTSPKDSVVVVSYPSLAALYEEDINDAIQYLNLRTLEGYHQSQPRELVAAYAGHGMGLSESWKCRTEDAVLPDRKTLVLHCGTMREAADYSDPDIDADTHYFPDPKNWNVHKGYLRSKLNVLLKKRYLFLRVPYFMTIIMTGERGADKEVSRSSRIWGRKFKCI